MSSSPSSSLKAAAGKYPNLVFVYGTLKTGEPNFAQMQDDNNGKALFVCSGRTLRPFPLVVATEYNIPFLLDKPGTGKRIRGEVFSVDDRMLSSLDAFEGVPDFYVRTREKVEADGKEQAGESASSSVEFACGLYVLPKFKPHLLEKTMLEEWKASDPNLDKYVPKSQRKSKPDYDSIRDKQQ